MARHTATPTYLTNLRNAQAEYDGVVAIAKSLDGPASARWVELTQPEFTKLMEATIDRRREHGEEESMLDALDARDADLLEGN